MKLKPQFVIPQVNTVGLVLYYKLWAGLTTTATVFDYSLSGNNGTPSGTSIVPANPGFDLAGSDEYFDTGSPFQLTFRGSFTIAMWVKLDDGRPAALDTLFGEFDSVGANSRVSISVGAFTGVLTFIYESEGNSGTNAATNTSAFIDNQTPWIFIAVTMDATVEGAGGKLIYVNGSIATLGASDGDTTGVTSSAFTSTTNVFIGALNTDGTDTENVAGLFDEPMIFNVAKTASEVQSIFESTRWRYGV